MASFAINGVVQAEYAYNHIGQQGEARPGGGSGGPGLALNGRSPGATDASRADDPFPA